MLLATLSAAPAQPPIPVIDGGETPADVVALGLTFYADGDYQRAARDGRTERTLFWRVYGIERGGIGILCETPLLTTRGFLVLLPSSFATDLRSRALLRITSTGEATCEPARDGIGPP